MKVRVTFKDPDVVVDAIRDAVEAQLEESKEIDEDEREQLIDGRVEKYQDFTSRWIRYGEYVTVEFDTDTDTATVIPSVEL